MAPEQNDAPHEKRSIRYIREVALSLVSSNHTETYHDFCGLLYEAYCY